MTPRLRDKLRWTAWWFAPLALALYLYWAGIFAWFQQDDFVWLNLLPRAHSFHDVLTLLFQPTDHGTWRPLPERAFFLSFGWLFGYNALPYRIVVFLTQCANLALAAAISRRLSGSALVGLLAAVFWIGSWELIVVMSWTSEYILPAVGFCLLLAFYLLLRYAETREQRYWRFCWMVFLLGFLMMETNIVFPLLAASFAFLYARPIFRKTLAFFVPSALYGVVHIFVANRQPKGVYTIHLDQSILHTLAAYAATVFQPESLDSFTRFPAWVAPAGAAAVGVALIAFTIWRVYRRDWLPTMLVAWFLFLLAPVLPLRDHIVPYYLTLPTLPLSMLGAVAMAAAWNLRTALPSMLAARVLATGLAAFYLTESAWVAHGGTEWWADRSHDVERLARFVFRLHRRRPEAVIVLRNVDSLLFWTGVAHYPFLDDSGRPYVYLASGSESGIEARPETGFRVADFVYPEDKLRSGLIHDRAVLIDVSRAGFFDVSSQFRPAAP